MQVRVIVGMTAAAGLVVSACGGDDGGGRLVADDYTVLGALAELPASLDSDEAQIMTADLIAASEAAGLERPADADDVDAVIDWIVPLTGGRLDEEVGQIAFVPMADVFGLRYGPDPGPFHDELGWSLVDAEAYVEYANPPERFSVISGEFDDETLSDGLIELDGGIMTNKEGEDGEQDLGDIDDAVRSIDMFGRPVRLAQDGERIVSSLQTPPVEEWVDGLDETLAHDDDLAAVAKALDDADVFSALLAGQGSSGFASSALLEDMASSGETDFDELRAQLEDETKGLPPAAFGPIGIGWGADDDGAVITIAYQHASEDDAAANAEAFDALFTDGTSIVSQQPLSALYELVGVETDGTVAVVTLRPGPDGHPSAAMQALMRRDVPFVYA